jgi:predicted ArsR family transcriptional regulator
MPHCARYGHNDGVDDRLRVHRALGDPSRARLVELLRRAGRGLDASELGTEVGLHPNTVRAHLEVLEDAGLVRSESERRNRPGRPRRLYLTTHDLGEDEHGVLAAALAGALEPIAEGPGLAEAAGSGWGRRLADDVTGGPAVDDRVGLLVDILDAGGFVPERIGNAITMHRCPYEHLVEESPRVVCAFHAGLISGALDRIDAGVELRELRPSAGADGCVASLGSLAP